MKKLYLFLGFILTCISCTKDKKSTEPADPHTGIYALGYRVTTGSALLPFPVYWAEGKETVLGDNKAYAVSVYLKGDDVYITGQVNEKPVLWKNGIAASLPIDGTSGATSSVSFYNDDIYVAGVDDGQVTIWKNNAILKKLPRYSDYKRTVMDNGNIHYLVQKYKIGDHVTEYWKNENMTEVLPHNDKIVQLAVLGEDVYFAGTNEKGTEISIWKNNVKSVIETASDTVHTEYQLANLCVDGKDVYLFYYDVDILKSSSIVKYSKNGTLYTLKTPDHFDPVCFKVIAGKIYYTGASTNDPATSGKAIYFIDGTVHYLSKDGDCGVRDITVK